MPEEKNPPVHITVCRACTDTSQSGESGLGAGGGLFSLLKDAIQDHPVEIVLESQRCLMACTEGCVLSIASEGKMQYLLGRLKPEEKLVKQVLDFVAMYALAPTGVTPNHMWPPLLGTHFLGRIRPVNPTDADWSDDGCNL